MIMTVIKSGVPLGFPDMRAKFFKKGARLSIHSSSPSVTIGHMLDLSSLVGDCSPNATPLTPPLHQIKRTPNAYPFIRAAYL